MITENAPPHAARVARNDELYMVRSDVNSEVPLHADAFVDGPYTSTAMPPGGACSGPCLRGGSVFWVCVVSCLLITRVSSAVVGASFRRSWLVGMTLASPRRSWAFASLWMGNGDYSSGECMRILDESDVVITNPPFSRLRDHVPMMLDHVEDVLIIGSLNSATYKGIRPAFMSGRMTMGVHRPHVFVDRRASADDEENRLKHFGNIRWMTTMTPSLTDNGGASPAF